MHTNNSFKLYDAFILFCVVYMQLGFVVPACAKENGLCIFVPGWQSQGTSYQTEIADIIEVLNWQYPNIHFHGQRCQWESFFGFWNGIKVSYQSAVKNTEKAGEDLYHQILQLPKQTQKNLVLVGHSLGCRVIANASALLEAKNIKIKQVIFFAAAITDDNPKIKSVLHCSTEAVLSFIHPQDGALMAARCNEKKVMLGLGSLKKRNKLRELLIAKNEYSIGGCFSPVEQAIEFFEYIPNHEVQHFIFAWEKSSYNWGMPLIDDIIIPQDWANVKKSAMDEKVFWTLVENCCGWELQQYDGGHYRILNPEKFRVASGNERVIQVFSRIKEQLQKLDSDEYLPKIPTGLILPAFTPTNSFDRIFLASIYHKDARIWNPESGHFEDLRTAHDMPQFTKDSDETLLDVEKIKESFEDAIEKQMKENNTYDPEVVYALGALLYSIGEKENGIALWKKSAEKDFHKALYELGLCYLNGECGMEDKTVGSLYLERAVKLGDIQAPMALAEFWTKSYQESQNEQDLKKSIEYWKIAAEKKHPGAQYMYAMFQPPKEAFDWFQKAAYQGIPEAQFEVGTMYYNGIGVNTDKYRTAYAVAWFKRAAEQGHLAAAYNLGVIYLYGNSNEGFQCNPWLAEKWLKIAADANYENAKELYAKACKFNRILEK